MIQATKWYGLTSKSPQDYFDKKCHSFNDIETLINSKGDNILKDIKPCFENFISNNENHEFITESLVDELITSKNPIANELAMEAISYAIDNIATGKRNDDNYMWFLWTNIPALERAYRSSVIQPETSDTLRESLESCVMRVAATLTTLDTDAVDPAVEEFMCNVSYTDMLNWEHARESVMDRSPMSMYIGDLIYNMTDEDRLEVASEGTSTYIDVTLENIARTLKYANSKIEGDMDSYREIVNDIWSELFDANESTFASTVERLYYSRHMTISMESYLEAIKKMITLNCLPAIENFDEISDYMLNGSKVDLSDINYNMRLWDRKPNMNILYTTESSASNGSLARKMTRCSVMDASTVEGMKKVTEAAEENPDMLYIAEGVSGLNIDVNFFKDKPLILNGQKYRHELMRIMNVTALESAFLFKTNIIENNGKIKGVDSIIRALESYSFDYIPATESSDEEKVSKSSKYEKKMNRNAFKRDMQKAMMKGKSKVSKAYATYRNTEEDIDTKLSEMIKACSDEVMGSNAARRKIVEGKSFSVVTTLKYILGGAAIFSVSKVAFFLILITRWCNSGKIEKAEKKKILAELEGELSIIDKKISYAESDGNREAVYSLMRTRNNVENAIKRIKKHQEADKFSSGIGAAEVLLRKRGG